MTFAVAVEKVMVGKSGHSQVSITDLGKVPAERLHPKAAYSSCRPIQTLAAGERSAASQREAVQVSSAA